MYISASEIETFHKNNKNHKLNVSGQDERELEAALQKSLKEMGNENKGEEAKKEEEHKFKAFTGKGVSLNEAADDKKGPQLDVNSDLYKALELEYGNDPEMLQVMMLSMQANEVAQLEVPEEPAEGADNVVNLQLRMPDGSKLQRRFLRSNNLGHVFNFVRKQKEGITTVKLITAFPKKVLEDAKMTLEEAKFGKSEAVNVDAK